MTLPRSVVRGSQQPRLLLLPSDIASRESGEAALALARSAGIVLDPWQEFCILHGCSERLDGSWAAFENYVDVPRQNGKGAILLVRQLAGLFVFEEPVQIHTAHEFKTAREHFIKLRDTINAAPELSKLVKHIYEGSGAESVVAHNGCRLLFLARSGKSGRGFSCDALYLDEAFKLSEEERGAMLPALSARPNPQIWYASSAAHADSDALHQLQDRLIKGESKRLFGASWSNEPGVNIDDLEAWARANPALGVQRPDGSGLTLEFTENELETLPRAEFLRERLGIAEAADGGSSVLPAGDWLACTDPASQIVGKVTIALDVTPEGSFASFGAAGLRADGVPHVEVIDRRPGTTWVVSRAKELAERWDCRIHVDPKSPTGGLLADLNAAGVPLVEIGLQDLAQACGLFQTRVVARGLRHIGDPELNASVVGASVRPVGEAWVWARRSSSVDISPLVAVTVANWAASADPPKRVFAF